ncbi:hypothetical protein BDV06DRAFT_63845 [Aspergillus oleicola]
MLPGRLLERDVVVVTSLAHRGLIAVKRVNKYIWLLIDGQRGPLLTGHSRLLHECGDGSAVGLGIEVMVDNVMWEPMSEKIRQPASSEPEACQRVLSQTEVFAMKFGSRSSDRSVRWTSSTEFPWASAQFVRHALASGHQTFCIWCIAKGCAAEFDANAPVNILPASRLFKQLDGKVNRHVKRVRSTGIISLQARPFRTARERQAG